MSLPLCPARAGTPPAGVGLTVDQKIKQALTESARLKLKVAEEQATLIAEMAREIIHSLSAGGKVVFFGNGGSAADAQHLAAELVGRFKRERQALPAIALTTNTSIVTALGNDYGYEYVFSRQVEALVTEKDVVLGSSTSGDSPSVLRAMEMARRRGAYCIGLTGENGQALAKQCDLCLIVPDTQAARIQETHIAVGHVLCGIVEDSLLRDHPNQ